MSAKLHILFQHHSSGQHGTGFVTTQISFLLWALLPILVVALMLASTAHAEQPAMPALKNHTIDFYDEYHALVVGVGQYDQWPLKPEAEDNARKVSWVLRKIGFSVKLLTNPTMKELCSSLDEFAQETGKEVNRGLLFYYSGNSQSSTSLDGKKIGRIIPKDAPVPGKNREAFEQHTISTDKIVTIANQIQSKHVLFLFDAALSADAFQVEPAVLRKVNATSALPTRQFITAGKAHTPIIEHTVFRKYLQLGLEGEADLIHDGVVSASELGIYLSDRVSKVTGEQLYPQFGTMTVEGDIRGDFIFQLTDRMPEIARLTVHPEPVSAKTRILNIKPQFTQGIELKPGKYRLQVSAKDFETYDKWIDLKAGEDRMVKIQLARKKEAITNSLGMRLIRVGQGSFMMGSTPDEPGRSNDEVRHRVKLTRPFFMQHTEVTVGQFKQFVLSTGYRTDAEKGNGCWITGDGKGWHQMPETSWKKPGSMMIEDDLPAICVTWNDAMEFARWLSKKERKTYRLPTEAEWEYASRAGTSTPFSTGRCLSTDEANYAKTGDPYEKCITVFRIKRGRPITVGQSAPNPWQLHDIHGNVSEWCSDWYGPFPSGKATNPEGPQSGSERVMRGGHWQSDAAGCRSAKRRRFPPNFSSDVVGFRLVMEQ
jgi:formylglycine-generating enzyme required for sulfatase activity